MANNKKDFIIYGDETEGGKSQEQKKAEPDLSALKILPLRNMTMFPEVTMPVAIIRESSRQLVNAAYEGKFPIGVLCQKNAEDDNPTLNDLYKYGVVADVVKLFELPDGSLTAIVEARSAMRVIGPSKAYGYFDRGLFAEVELLNDVQAQNSDIEYPVIIDIIRKQATDMVEKSGNEPGVQFAIKDCPDHLLINMVATTIPVEVGTKQSLLEIRSSRNAVCRC